MDDGGLCRLAAPAPFQREQESAERFRIDVLVEFHSSLNASRTSQPTIDLGHFDRSAASRTSPHRPGAGEHAQINTGVQQIRCQIEEMTSAFHDGDTNVPAADLLDQDQ